MNKKIISLLLISALAVLLMPHNISATESEAAESSCYIATTECPQEYVDFAKENASGFVLSMGETLNYDDIRVGSPFAFADYNADVYYFPIICDGVITYLFRVYPDQDSYSAAITAFLADDIEALAELTSAETPMYLNLIDDKIVASIGTDEYVLFEYVGAASEDNQVMTMSMAEYEVTDIKETFEIELNLKQTRDVYKYINLDITEIQQSNNWCVAYSLAAIIRTKTNFYATAYGCMIIAVGSNVTSSDYFPWSSISTVSKQYGLTPTVLTTTASNSVLIAELNAGRPVIAVMDSGTERHAVVLRGYSTNTWSIWNPRCSTYENYSMSGAYVPTGYSASGYSYYPYQHAYNFG